MKDESEKEFVIVENLLSRNEILQEQVNILKTHIAKVKVDNDVLTEKNRILARINHEDHKEKESLR